MAGLRDTDAILEALGPELEPLQSAWGAARERLTAGARMARRTGAVILGTGLLFAAVAQSGIAVVVTITLTLVIGGGLYHLKVIKPKGEMESMIRDTVIGSIVRLMEPEMEFSPHSGISEEAFTASRLFRRPDRYRSDDGLSGRIGDTELFISEVHAEQRHESRNSKGQRRVHYTTIFRGVFMIADFHKHFQGTTRVLPDTAESILGSLGRKLQSFRPFSSEELVYLEDPDFEREFVVYSTDQVEARYIISTSMTHRILELRRRWDDDVRLSFLESRVCVAISHRHDLLEPDVRDGTLDRGQVERVVAELDACFALVDDLNLNTRIWSKK